jgi:hypothetical protein
MQFAGAGMPNPARLTDLQAAAVLTIVSTLGRFRCLSGRFRTIPMLTAIVLAVLIAPAAYSAVNSITISETQGISSTDYPVQIGRPFVEGEVANFPQAIVNGKPVLTQADVKQRWSDGSVKHAIVSFIVPTLPARGSVTVTFQNQATGNNTPLTKEQMLSPSFSFDAEMELRDAAGNVRTASARKMLEAGAFTYWTSGPVATTVILADHSVQRAFDIGFDQHRSFRPIFHATFWPGLNKVRVRYIGEIANSEVLQDMTYSVALKLGMNAATPVYSKAGMTHYAASRWTKQYWIGGVPLNVNLDHNLEYVKQTRFTFNYDTSIRVPETTIAAEYKTWLSRPRDLYDAGDWTKGMPAAAGRPEIGPYPMWTVYWLYTGDARMQEKAFGNADLAAAWPVHLREGDPKRFVDRAKTVPGIGRPVSISTRPTLSVLQALNWAVTAAADRLTFVGPFTNGGWVPDISHLPDTASPQYFLSGDFWYLEEMMFYTSWSTASNGNAGTTTVPWSRSPTGAEAATYGSVRGEAWTLRGRAHTAFMTPDQFPEKPLFEMWINDAIAVREGAWDLVSNNEGSALWRFGRTIRAAGTMETRGGSRVFPPLHQHQFGGVGMAQASYGINTGFTKDASSYFEQHMMMMVLGRMKELGYATDKLVSYLGKHYTTAVSHPDFNPFLLANGRIPSTRASDGEYIDNWADLKKGFTAEWQTRTAFPRINCNGGYDYLAMAGISYLTGEPGGKTAWSFMKSNLYDVSPCIKANPQFAILPREAADAPDQASLCDVNGDRKVDNADIEFVKAQYHGKTSCGHGDVDKNGVCNVVDVQIVSNAVRGAGCAAR